MKTFNFRPIISAHLPRRTDITRRDNAVSSTIRTTFFGTALHDQEADEDGEEMQKLRDFLMGRETAIAVVAHGEGSDLADRGIEAERIEAERTEADRRVDAAQVEADRRVEVEAERIEAEQVEAERIEAERTEADRRLDAEQVEADRRMEVEAETERVKADQIVAKSISEAKAKILQDREETPTTPPSSSTMQTTFASSHSPSLHNSPSPPRGHVSIVGGGPAGLTAAIAFARRNIRVSLYDRQRPPLDPDDETIWSETAKFYLIGLGARGQKALDEFDLWEGEGGVKSYCQEVVGRKDWSPGGDSDGTLRIFTDRPYTTSVLPREKLVGVLHKKILSSSSYSDLIDLNFRTDATLMLDEDKKDDESKTTKTTSTLVISDCTPTGELEDQTCDAEKIPPNYTPKTVEADFVVACDGAVRGVAKTVEWKSKQPSWKKMRVVKYKDDNRRTYKTIPITFPDGDEWRGDINYSARTSDGRINFDALPANGNKEYCGVFLLKEDDEFATDDTDPKELRKLLDSSLPQFSRFISERTLSEVAAKPVSSLPSFRYVKNKLNYKNVVVLGDAAHTVKPYFGLGANSALEDVSCLARIVDEHAFDGGTKTADFVEVADKFSRERKGEAAALVKISRGLDRPGLLGFVSFIFPLILDGIFHNLMPSIIRPNVIAMLQRTDYDFRGVARRKRQDRAVQLAILGGAVGVTSNLLSKFVKKTTMRSKVSVLFGAVALLMGKSLLSRTKDYAPADAQNLMKKAFGNNESFLMKLRTSQKGYGKKVGNDEKYDLSKEDSPAPRQ